MSYCTAIDNLQSEEKTLHKNYHDNYYSFPLHPKTNKEWVKLFKKTFRFTGSRKHEEGKIYYNNRTISIFTELVFTEFCIGE